MPDGTRRVIDIRGARWTAPETLRQLVEIHQRYGSIVTVEGNGAQVFLEQFASELTALPLRRFYTTGQSKHGHFGVESLGVELEQRKWILPSTLDGQPAGQVGELVRGLLAYDPAKHMSDYLAAMWIAREGARESGFGGGTWLTDEDYFDVDAVWGERRYALRGAA
jgi:hypothetical protein